MSVHPVPWRQQGPPRCPLRVSQAYAAPIFAHTLHTHALSSSCSSSPSLLSALCLQDTPSQPTNPTSATVLSHKPRLQNLHWLPPPPKGWAPGGPQNKHASFSDIPYRLFPNRSTAAPHLPFLEWGEGRSLKPPQPSHLSPASGERDKRKEELWVLFHETPRFCTKMQGVLLFAFFLSFLKITMKLSFPPTAFSLSYLDLAGLLREVVWSHWQPPALALVSQTYRWHLRRCTCWVESLGWKGKSTTASHNRSLLPCQ